MNGPGIQGTQRGVLLAFATAAISGLSVYLNAFGVRPRRSRRGPGWASSRSP